MTKTITLAHGNGGAENNELIKEVFYDAFKNEILEKTLHFPCFPPDYIEVNYISGCKSNCTSCNDCGVCDQLERTVAILAAAMLPQAFCNCTCLQTQLQYQQTNDTAKANGILTYGVPFEILNNPFGQRFGEIEAYQNLKVLEEYLCNS